MSISTLRWAYGSALALVAGLAGCSGQQSSSGSLVPAGANTAPTVRSDRHSWMAPDAKSTDLLYVSDASANDVYVFSYPQLKPEGKLTGFHFPFGECVDKRGNVFIANDNAAKIFEYAHGGTSPIATLNDPGYHTRGCSIDPTTGNLAVAGNAFPSQGKIAIYKGAKGNPSAYFAGSNVYYIYSCAYDNAGNLFIDGENNGSSSFEFAELPNGAKKFTNISLNQAIGIPGGVQWDGKYVAVGDQYTNIYRFSIHGKTGTKVGTTPLTGASRDSEFWIQGSNVIVPDSVKLHVGIWDYPAGGSAEQRVKGFKYPIGATVSLAQ